MNESGSTSRVKEAESLTYLFTSLPIHPFQRIIHLYLSRVHFPYAAYNLTPSSTITSTSLPPTLSLLNHLIHLHLHYIPFENLTQHRSKPYLLHLDYLVHKVLVQRQGGLCFELNALFAHLLSLLSFSSVSLLPSSVQRGHASHTFSHYTSSTHIHILLSLSHQLYIVDVGFGSPCPEALKLGVEQQGSDGKVYRVIEDEEEELGSQYYYLQHKRPSYIKRSEKEVEEARSARLLEGESPSLEDSEWVTRTRIIQADVHSHLSASTNNFIELQWPEAFLPNLSWVLQPPAWLCEDLVCVVMRFVEVQEEETKGRQMQTIIPGTTLSLPLPSSSHPRLLHTLTSHTYTITSLTAGQRILSLPLSSSAQVHSLLSIVFHVPNDFYTKEGCGKEWRLRCRMLKPHKKEAENEMDEYRIQTTEELERWNEMYGRACKERIRVRDEKEKKWREELMSGEGGSASNVQMTLGELLGSSDGGEEASVKDWEVLQSKL